MNARAATSRSGDDAHVPGGRQRRDIVRVGEKVGYALGDVASNFFWKTFETFLLFFYTDVFGISAAAAGTMFLVTRIWDAVNDPIMGSIADRTRTRFGRFRPYLLWGALPLAAAGVLTFTTPGLSGSGKLVWAYVTYVGMMMAYTAINIPYSALMGVVTADSQARTSLASFRFVGAFTGGLLVQKFTLDLVEWFGRGDAAFGWQATMMFYVAWPSRCSSSRLPPPEKGYSRRRGRGRV